MIYYYIGRTPHYLPNTQVILQRLIIALDKFHLSEDEAEAFEYILHQIWQWMRIKNHDAFIRISVFQAALLLAWFRFVTGILSVTYRDKKKNWKLVERINRHALQPPFFWRPIRLWRAFFSSFGFFFKEEAFWTF